MRVIVILASELRKPILHRWSVAQEFGRALDDRLSVDTFCGVSAKPKIIVEAMEEHIGLMIDRMVHCEGDELIEQLLYCKSNKYQALPTLQCRGTVSVV